jgi:hypothetical protein
MEAKIVANNEKFEVLRGTLIRRAITEANQERTAKMAAWIQRTEACVEKLVANREKLGAVAAHPEVPNEEAEVETVGALEDRPRAMVGLGRSRPPSAD